MINIKIEDQTRQFQALSNLLSDKNLTIANVRSINVAIRKANTQYRREVVKNYNLKYADTANITLPKRATYSDPEGTISGELKPISISRFNPVFIKDGLSQSIKNIRNKETKSRSLERMVKETRKKDSEGVTFEIKKGEKKRIPFAFMINTDKAGLALQVWARGVYKENKFNTSKLRLPISPLKTVSPFGTLTTEPVKNVIESSSTDVMQKEFERQVNLLLSKKL